MASRATLVIESMIAARKLSHPNDQWSREIPFGIQAKVLGEDVTVAAESDNGVITITLPKPPESKAKRIEVKAK